MALNNGITVRLDPEARERLEAIAQRFGVKSSVLIRLAVMEKLEAIEAQSAIVLKPVESASVTAQKNEAADTSVPSLVADEKKNS